MRFFKKLLFPVDLSNASSRIAPYVSQMANRFEAEIHCLFVARNMDHYASIYVPDPFIKDFAAEIIKGGEQKLEEFINTVFKEHEVKGTIVSGDPSEEILRYAAKEEIDLIIMGTHGRKGLERIFFGSVAERVVKKSHVPVMTVNPNMKESD